MAVRFQISGEPGRDNALLVTVDSGQSLHRLLFDCGEGCLSGLGQGEIQEIEAVFFSHFHMDHVAGFDRFVRTNWSRSEKPVRIFGPRGTIEVMHHRLRGFVWNLAEGTQGNWIVTDIEREFSVSAQFSSADGFSKRQDLGRAERENPVYCGESFEVSAVELDHGTPSMAYLLREHERTNVDIGLLVKRRLQPGPWMQRLKDPGVRDDEVLVNGLSAGELRDSLLRKTPGESIAYVTDFILRNDAQERELAEFLKGCGTLVCENNYCNADADLAARHSHMTSRGVASLARRAQAGRLILFHLSDRYTKEEWCAQLEEAREVFPNAEFPAGWDDLL